MRFSLKKLTFVSVFLLALLGSSLGMAQPAAAITSIADITPSPAPTATPVVAATPVATPTPTPVAVAPVTPTPTVTATPVPSGDLADTGTNPSYIILAAASLLIVISITQLKQRR